MRPRRPPRRAPRPPGTRRLLDLAQISIPVVQGRDRRPLRHLAQFISQKADPIYRRGQMSDLSRIVHARRHRRDLRQQQPHDHARAPSGRFLPGRGRRGPQRPVEGRRRSSGRCSRGRARTPGQATSTSGASWRGRRLRAGFIAVFAGCGTTLDREHAGGTRVDAKLNRRDALPPGSSPAAHRKMSRTSPITGRAPPDVPIASYLA